MVYSVSSLQLHTTQAVQNHSYMHEQSLLLRDRYSVYSKHQYQFDGQIINVYFLPVTVILLHE